ncbi:MAG: hypothetical protein NWR72_18430 [Bacteroidia bacterium]|nr:hypothetical protein [Bacteroidia bacterium]
MSRTILFPLLLMLGLLQSSGAWAQASKYPEGYIVSNQGDTTKGFVRTGDDFRDQQYIIFYDEYAVKAKYTPERISAFGYNDRHYESKPRPYLYSGLLADTVMFLQRKINGQAKLFRFYTRRSIFTLQNGPAFFDLLQKPDGKLYEVSYNFKWKRIADALEEYPELAQAIRNDLFGPEDIAEIIRAYNDWYREQRKGMEP